MGIQVMAVGSMWPEAWARRWVHVARGMGPPKAPNLLFVRGSVAPIFHPIWVFGEGARHL